MADGTLLSSFYPNSALVSDLPGTSELARVDPGGTKTGGTGDRGHAAADATEVPRPGVGAPHQGGWKDGRTGTNGPDHWTGVLGRWRSGPLGRWTGSSVFTFKSWLTKLTCGALVWQLEEKV